MIHLMYAGNDRVFDGLMISSLSAAKHAREPLTLWLLTMDYTEARDVYTPITERQCAFLERVLQEKNPDSRVVRCDLGDLYRLFLKNNPNEETSYTPYCMLRLLADRLPGLPDKVLYVDTDTVFARDPALLYHMDISKYEAAVVRDRYGRRVFGRNYFNSGVMLMNVYALRRSGALKRAVFLCSKRKIFLPDQSALYMTIRKKKMLPSRFNEQKKLRRRTVIRHFSMTINWRLPRFYTRNIKPWQVDELHGVLRCHEFDDILAEWKLRKAEYESAEQNS